MVAYDIHQRVRPLYIELSSFREPGRKVLVSTFAIDTIEVRDDLKWDDDNDKWESNGQTYTLVSANSDSVAVTESPEEILQKIQRACDQLEADAQEAE